MGHVLCFIQYVLAWASTRRPAILCALMMCGLSAPVSARAPYEALALPCVKTSLAVEPVRDVLGQPRGFDCSRQVVGESGPVTYALYRGLNVRSTARDPLEFRHPIFQVREERVYVRYADGVVGSSPTSLLEARKLYSSGVLAFVLPPRPQPITAVLVVAEGLQNQRGFGISAQLLPHSAAIQIDLGFLVVFALLGGAMLALLAYNLSLYKVLRYRFIFAHCISTLAIIVFGLGWSGGIFYFVPDMTPITQISITMAALSLYLITLVAFMVTFIERSNLDRRAVWFVVAMAGLNLLASIVRLIAYTWAWQRVDFVTYTSLLATLLGLIFCASRAHWRGSRSARYYLIAWSIPITFAVIRILWGVSSYPGMHRFVSISPLFIMVLESMTSVFAVSWRIGQLRNERDAARASHAMLKHLAETDSLTGLYNRRAFLERAREGDGFKQLILIDIDDFKAINDTFGHDIGDQVIAGVARAMVEQTSEHCLVGRMGGEEYAILVPDLAPFLAQRVCNAISAISVFEGVKVTASAGVAIGPVATAEDWHALYIAADQALYQAKRTGRNRVCQSNQLAAA